VKIHHPSDVIAGAILGMALARVARRVWPFPSVPE
jgi:membrane-associated phospholipid phosphatase